MAKRMSDGIPARTEAFRATDVSYENDLGDTISIESRDGVEIIVVEIIGGNEGETPRTRFPITEVRKLILCGWHSDEDSWKAGVEWSLFLGDSSITCHGCGVNFIGRGNRK